MVLIVRIRHRVLPNAAQWVHNCSKDQSPKPTRQRFLSSKNGARDEKQQKKPKYSAEASGYLGRKVKQYTDELHRIVQGDDLFCPSTTIGQGDKKENPKKRSPPLTLKATILRLPTVHLSAAPKKHLQSIKPFPNGVMSKLPQDRKLGLFCRYPKAKRVFQAMRYTELNKRPP